MTEEQCITVGMVMTHEVRTIDRMATARKAIRIMRDADVSSLVVENRATRARALPVDMPVSQTSASCADWCQRSINWRCRREVLVSR